MLRSEQISDINEPGRRTFAPYNVIGVRPGDAFGQGNPLRRSRILESALIDRGFRFNRSQRDYFVLAANLSFIGSNWFARVIASPRYIPNSFDNAYRNLNGLNFQDYNAELGAIVRIMNYNDSLLVIYERGIIILPINERIQTGADSAGAILVEAMGILPPTGGPVNLRMGTMWHDSVISADSGVYGIDTDTFTLWAFTSEGFSEVSRLRYEPEMSRLFSSYRNAERSLIGKNIVAHYERVQRRILWSVIDGRGISEAFAYNELTQSFTGSLDYVPLKSFNINGRFHSFNSEENRNQLFIHHSKSVPYCNFYGRQYGFAISFVVNENSDLQKVFDNLVLISNNILPDRITYITQGTRTVQQVVYDPRIRRISNVHYHKNQANVAIPTVQEVTDQGEKGFIPALRDNTASMLRKKSKQKGKAILITLEYRGDKMVKISSVLTDYRPVI